MIDLFINGKRLKSSSGETRNIIHPADGSIVEVAQEATNSDVEMAIKSAHLAFETGPWSKTTNAHRSSVLKRIADLLERDKASFAKAESKFKVLEKVAPLVTANKPELSTFNQVAVEEPITKAFSPVVLLIDKVANGVVVPMPTLSVVPI